MFCGVLFMKDIIKICKKINCSLKKSFKHKFVVVRGFTLIELLVVISIIGVLASLVLVQFPNSLKSARDAKRLQEINQIVTALRIYKVNNGVFPPISSDVCCDGWDQGPCQADTTFIATLKTSGTIPVVPEDSGNYSASSGTGCYGYNYYVYPAGYASCPVASGAFFVLGIRDMETKSGVYPESPGWKCPGRNWQSEFEWVAGGFEKDF